jgi:hypothetical protein
MAPQAWQSAIGAVASGRPCMLQLVDGRCSSGHDSSSMPGTRVTSTPCVAVSTSFRRQEGADTHLGRSRHLVDDLSRPHQAACLRGRLSRKDWRVLRAHRGRTT